MKYKPEFPMELSEDRLEQDLRGAVKLGKLLMGKENLYFSRFAGGTFLPISQIRHAYLRIEEVKARVCCGIANFDQTYLMILGADDKLRKYLVSDKEAGQQALDHIAALNPETKIGYYKT